MEEAREEVMATKDHHQTQLLLKGKRTKRQRLATPLTLATMGASSSSSAEVVDFANTGRLFNSERVLLDRSTASPTTSTELFTPNMLLQGEDHHEDEEEEDMANCLILLAQGQSRKSSSIPITTTTNKAQRGGSAYYLYQCKTCDRCFPSFQALGGHRASHKKLKLNNPPEAEIKKSLDHDQGHDFYNTTTSNITTNTTLSLQVSNSVGVVSCNPNHKSKVHECSICGAEFSSGQALGGHMRRHRSFTSTPTRTTSLATSSPDHDQSQSQQEAGGKKLSRNVLSLDLNLPPANPEEDQPNIQRESKFPFASKQVLAFSASPLVDCHY